MSTQTQTPAELAEEFLRKYATVIGTLDAIERKDRDFLLKYATVVGSKDAIDLVAPETTTVPPTDPEGDGTETGNIGGDGMEDDDTDNE